MWTKNIIRIVAMLTIAAIAGVSAFTLWPDKSLYPLPTGVFVGSSIMGQEREAACQSDDSAFGTIRMNKDHVFFGDLTCDVVFHRDLEQEMAGGTYKYAELGYRCSDMPTAENGAHGVLYISARVEKETYLFLRG